MELSEPDADSLVPKPDGKISCNKWGYSLQKILGWDNKTYHTIKQRVNFKISNYLNHSLSIPNQPADFVKNLTKLVCCALCYAEFPSSDTL